MKKVEWEYGSAETDGTIVRFNVSTKAYGEKWAVVDADVWGQICHLKWRATRRKNKFYVRYRDVLLHRFIMQPPPDLVVDHIDDDGLNNTRRNMQICTKEQNISWGADRKRGCTMAEFQFSKWISSNPQWNVTRSKL
ncbi:hypothetical protein ACLB6G_20565 [Zhengella sp. ZM62]|uniref:hypothetical protein n=1 Tax=Zhengella sedimenti TaxID=3390035 RepID=UPI003974D0D4